MDCETVAAMTRDPSSPAAEIKLPAVRIPGATHSYEPQPTLPHPEPSPASPSIK
jgi:hypothetical protein